MTRSRSRWTRQALRCWSPSLYLHVLLILLLTRFTNGEFELNNETSPTHTFRSRPDLHAPIIDMRILRPELVAPGYIFIAPYRNLDPGPYIYDNYGDLIWSGAGQSGPKVAHAPHTCQYKGSTHLCFFQGEQHQGFARGHGTIMDQTYRTVKTIDSSGAGASADMHEHRMTPHSDGKSVLMTVYQPRMFDLTSNPRFRIKGGIGWIVEGVFQEVEIETGRVLFEWRSTDHIDPGLSYTFPSTTDTSGDGLSEDTPWDYFHINSIDKNTAGDYLISARHVAGIYKLSGVDGHLMWQLGGANPTFNQTNFNFSSQHHARWISENTTHTLLSFFDNGSNTFNITNELSHGYVVSIDHVLATATVVRSWGAPDGGLSSGSQGNLQLLPNGNVHLGWGEHAHFSEHTWDGDPVQYGVLAARESNVMVYRSYKFDWIGSPLTKPALWTYARSSAVDGAAAGIAFFVSWNGATEVRRWRFLVAETATGPYQPLGETPKRGFETTWRADIVWSWSYAEALDAHGNVLERSEISRTFIPGPSLAPYCDDWGCAKAERVEDENYDAGAAEAFRVDWELESPQRGWDTGRYYAEYKREKSGGESAIAWGSLLLGMAAGIAIMLITMATTGMVNGTTAGKWRETTGKSKDLLSSWATTGREQAESWRRRGEARIMALRNGYTKVDAEGHGLSVEERGS